MLCYSLFLCDLLCPTVCQLTPVKVTEGAQSVLLPYTPRCSLQDAVRVEWTKLKNNDHLVVCVFKNGQILREQQHPAYMNITDMKKDALTECDVSLTLRKPLLFDGGVYVCSIYNKDGITINQKVVPLLVRGQCEPSDASDIICLYVIDQI